MTCLETTWVCALPSDSFEWRCSTKNTVLLNINAGVPSDHVMQSFEGQLHLGSFLCVVQVGGLVESHFLGVIGSEFRIPSISPKGTLVHFMRAWLYGGYEEPLIAACFRSDIFRDLLAHLIESNTESVQSEDIDVQLELIRVACHWLNEHYWPDHSPALQEDLLFAEVVLWCVTAQLFSYGILTSYFADPEVSEILVNQPQQIYYEKAGRLHASQLEFPSEDMLLSLIQKLAAKAHRRIDQSVPYCDARLAGGERMHAIIPPLAKKGPTLSVRRFPAKPLSPETMVHLGTLDTDLLALLKRAVEERKNIFISGGTSTGKTTFLNCLSSFIQSHHRVITIEDAAELSLQQQHVVSLESRPANSEGFGEVTIRDLVRNALRMRPDRIILGECRGAEAFDVLQAMNTGHAGSLATVHANSVHGALLRIQSLVMMADAGISLSSVQEMLSSAVDFVVHLHRSEEGNRYVTEVAEIVGYDRAADSFQFKTHYMRG